MPLRLRIDHRSRYEYERPVSLSPHFVRLFPRTEPGRLVQKVEFATNAKALVQYRRDLYDNNFARCYYPEHEADLFFDYALEIELHEQNPFDFLLDYDASQYPFSYKPDDRVRLAPFLDFSEAAHFGTDVGAKLLPLPFWTPPGEPVSTVSMLVSLLEAMHKNLGYERREEGAARSPVETLRVGSGACRDIAVLLGAVLRELGLAARLASGYLCEFGQDASHRRAEGAMHLWTDVYLPGAGWTGLDATNGIFCNHNFITTAVGLTTAEITPISGRYFADVVVTNKMSATIELTALGPVA